MSSLKHPNNGAWVLTE